MLTRELSKVIGSFEKKESVIESKEYDDSLHGPVLRKYFPELKECAKLWMQRKKEKPVEMPA